jgi:hypothetical protein
MGRLVFPERVKPVPVTVMAETVIDVELVLVTSTELVLVCPTVTLPKSTVDGKVNRAEEPVICCGAPHPAIRVISRPNAAGSHLRWGGKCVEESFLN